MSVRIIARVECRSEGAAEQVPVAVWLAGHRLPVAETLEDAIEGTVEAGQPTVRCVRVRLVDGQDLELRRELPLGDWQVWRERRIP